jgi:hypothetical protein
MKKIGFVGLAEATTFIGEATLAPAVGLETVRGKSSEPVPQADVAGSCAMGAGRLLVLADHVTGTGGVEGYEGCDGVLGGLGGAGGAVVVVVWLGLPHPACTRLRAIHRSVAESNRPLPRIAGTTRIIRTSGKSDSRRRIQDRER